MIVFASAALFAAIGVLFFIKRRQLAELQSMMAGGTVVPGCAVAEGVVFLILAALALIAHRMGMLP